MNRGSSPSLRAVGAARAAGAAVAAAAAGSGADVAVAGRRAIRRRRRRVRRPPPAPRRRRRRRRAAPAPISSWGGCASWLASWRRRGATSLRNSSHKNPQNPVILESTDSELDLFSGTLESTCPTFTFSSKFSFLRKFSVSLRRAGNFYQVSPFRVSKSCSFDHRKRCITHQKLSTQRDQVI